MRPARFLMLLMVLLQGGRVGAHGIDASYTEVRVTPRALEVVHLLTVEELVSHFPMAIAAPGGDSLGAFEDAAPAIISFLDEHITVLVDGHAVPLKHEVYSLHAHGTFVRFRFSASLEHQVSALTVAATEGFFERFGARQTHFVSLAVEDQSHQAIVTVSRRQATFTTGYGPIVSQCVRFVKLGLEHIFLGYDHVLFLCALVIVGGRLGPLVKTVSAFTVAHSLTLALAVLDVIRLPSHLIEGAIAVTIAYVAFDNFFVPATAQRWVLTFCFGLIHGFGFADVLREVSMPRSQLVTSLISFNLGVEIGQVVIVSMILPMTLWLARQRFHRQVVMAASGLAFLLGIGWFFEHAFGLAFMPI